MLKIVAQYGQKVACASLCTGLVQISKCCGVRHNGRSWVKHKSCVDAFGSASDRSGDPATQCFSNPCTRIRMELNTMNTIRLVSVQLTIVKKDDLRDVWISYQ